MKRRNDVEAFMTLDEIAPIIGVSKERVRQIEVAALKKIKLYLLQRFGESVTIDDILPSTRKELSNEPLPIL
jgi:Sigma-70, region 4